MMCADRISSSTSCSIWLPEIAPPVPLWPSSVTVFKVATLPDQPLWLKEIKKMEGAKLPNGKKSARREPNSRRSSRKKTERKTEKLVCRYCGSDDLAPSFIKRRDRRCRKCFSKRYGSAARGKKVKAKK